MKRRTLIGGIVATILLSTSIAFQPASATEARAGAGPAAEQVSTVPLYRMYHAGTGINFYTANPARRKNAAANGWSTIGKAGYVFDRKMPGTVPLYMAITDQGAGAIFVYTINFDEVLKLTRKRVWWTEGDGIVCYVAPAQLPGTRPLYRLQRPNIGTIGRSDSFYTTSKAERDSAVSQAQYQLVGTEGYVWSASVTW